MRTTLVAWCSLLAAVGGVAAQSAEETDGSAFVYEARVGSSPVGTVFEIWRDPAREEDWTSEPDDVREVGVRLFYPAAETVGYDRAEFFAQGEIVRDQIEASWGTRPTELVLTAFEAAPAVPCADGCPLVLLSHGMIAGHWTMNELALNLASAGFIVATLEHPFVGLTSVRASGELIPPGSGGAEVLEYSRLRLDQAIQTMLQVMSEDQRFVADELARVAEGELQISAPGLAQALDLELVFAGGHSIGGMAADRSCLRYSVFDACFSLDGSRWLPLLAGWAPPTEKPFMVLFSEAFWLEDHRFADRYLTTFSNLAAFRVEGSRHDSFVNVASMFGATDEDSPERATHAAILPLVRDFLEGATRSGFDAASLLDQAVGVLTVVDFEAMRESEVEQDLAGLYYPEEEDNDGGAGDDSPP